MTISTQGVVAALKQGEHSTARTRGISVERSGAAVRKLGDKVRVYYMSPVRAGNETIEKYAETLRAAGYAVELRTDRGWFLDVISKED